MITIQVSEEVLNLVQNVLETFKSQSNQENGHRKSAQHSESLSKPSEGPSCDVCVYKSSKNVETSSDPSDCIPLDPDQIADRFRDAVNEYKKARGWTLTKVAFHCNVTLSQLSNCLYAGRGASLHAIVKVINALNLDPFYVFFGLGEGPFQKPPVGKNNDESVKVSVPPKEYQIVKYVVDRGGQVTAKDLVNRFGLRLDAAYRLVCLSRTLVRAIHASATEEAPPPRNKTEAVFRFLLKNGGAISRMELARKFDITLEYAGRLKNTFRYVQSSCSF